MTSTDDIAPEDFIDIWFRCIYQKSILLDLNSDYDFTSKTYYIDQQVEFKYRVITRKVNETMLLLVQLNKQCHDKISYEMKLFCCDLGIRNKRINTDCKNWHILWDAPIKQRPYRFHTLYYQISVLPTPTTFIAHLYDDQELTDFTLKGEDGSVHVHRTILAASSWKLKKKFCEDWKRCTEGYLDIPGVNFLQATLQALKDFLYLNKIPTTGQGPLLLLSRHYDIHTITTILQDKLDQAALIEAPEDYDEILDQAPLHNKNRIQLGSEKMIPYWLKSNALSSYIKTILFRVQ